MSHEQLTVASGVVAVLKTDRRLWGRVGEWLPERNRWVLTLPNGVDCAAREDQLEAVRLEPGVKVKVMPFDKDEQSSNTTTALLGPSLPFSPTDVSESSHPARLLLSDQRLLPAAAADETIAGAAVTRLLES